MFMVVFTIAHAKPLSDERVYFGSCRRFSIDKYDLDMFPSMLDVFAGLAGITKDRLHSLGDIHSVEIIKEI